MGDAGEEVNPWQMPLQNLSKMRENVRRQVEQNKQRYQSMSAAMARYKESLRSIEMITKSKTGQRMLVPMNEAIYVPGAVGSTTHVTVEIGTGFFVRRTVKDANDYVNRKINALRVYMEQLGQSILAMQSNRDQIEKVFRARVAAVREQAEGMDKQA